MSQTSDNCIGCDIHGFPCFRCADDVYYGELGPGFLNGEQIILQDTDATTRAVMEKWCTDHPNEHVVRQQPHYSEPEPRVYVYRASVKTVVPFDSTYVRSIDHSIHVKQDKTVTKVAAKGFLDRIRSKVLSL